MEKSCRNCAVISCKWMGFSKDAACDKWMLRSTDKQPETDTTETATHYQVSDKQPIEIMQDYLPHDQFIGFLRGNVIKYQLRLGHKGETVKDALKCWQYADWLAKALKGEKIVPGGKK